MWKVSCWSPLAWNDSDPLARPSIQLAYYFCALSIPLTVYAQTRLNIPDMPMGGFGGGGGGAAPAAAAPVEEEEAAPAAAEKTLFNLKLEKFDAGSKPKVIKEIKSMLGLSLVDSKKFVESAPKMMKEGVPKEEAEKIVETLKALGATAVME
jgi:large subunit ribosomal protein L7/L12